MNSSQREAVKMQRQEEKEKTNHHNEFVIRCSKTPPTTDYKNG